MALERRNFTELGLPAGPYTHAVAHAETLYTSGFTAFGTDAQHGDARQQTHAALDHLGFIADQYGRSLADLIKVTVFITDRADLALVRQALIDRYGGSVPASSLVLVAGLFAPELRVEIEAIFAV
jgi:2-iminobutanoate/2-iminopropanoate deaminase